MVVPNAISYLAIVRYCRTCYEHEPGCEGAAAMSDEARRDWEIRIVREAIARDWAWLASHNLSTEQRRAVRDHLSVHVTALRELAERHRLALQSVRANREERFRD